MITPAAPREAPPAPLRQPPRTLTVVHLNDAVEPVAKHWGGRLAHPIFVGFLREAKPKRGVLTDGWDHSPAFAFSAVSCAANAFIAAAWAFVPNSPPCSVTQSSEIRRFTLDFSKCGRTNRA